MSENHESANASAVRRHNLGRLLRPSHVAVIGGAAAEEAVRQLDLIDFEGPVWPVNPRRESMGGRACFASIADLPEAPDAAVVAVPAAVCPTVFAELNLRGAGGGICFAAGFGEDGDAVLERDLVEAAGDCALVGPNCHGIINLFDRAVLWPDDHGADPLDGAGFALISQSGNVAMNATFEQRSAPFGYVIGTGNQAQLGVEDFIEALLDDPRVRAIGLFIEGLRDIRRFSAAAWRALEAGVPIVALKVGASIAGARASRSHTGALTGSDDAFQALLDRLNIRRARTPSELIETLKFLTLAGPLSGRKVVSLSCSGGEAALMGDALSAAGLECPAPSRTEPVARAFRIRPESVGNPLDYNTRIWGDAAASAAGFAEVLADPWDAAVLVLDFPPRGRARPDNWRAACDGFLAASRNSNVPAAILATLPEALPEEVRADCMAAGVTPLQGMGSGVRAIAHAAAWSERRGELLDGMAWQGPLAAEGRGDVHSLDEATGKAWLAEYGITVPPSRITDGSGLAAAAAEVGYPVVLKAVGAGLEHKSDLGALALDLRDAQAVQQAACDIEQRLQAAGLAVERWLVERMVADAVAELIVGVVRDEVIGPVLVIGSGGVLTELVHDACTLPLPTTRADIQRALQSLAVARILAGYRGAPAGDVEAAVEACLAVAHFAEENVAQLVELDLNPLLVRPPGGGVIAADALIRVVASEAFQNADGNLHPCMHSA